MAQSSATASSIWGAGAAIGIRPCAPRLPAARLPARQSWTPLAAGDVISTGTPEGVGYARKPPLWMKPGDVVEVEIDGGVGILRNPIVAES